MTSTSSEFSGQRSEFKNRLQRLIQRVEAWSYSDTEAGSGVPVEVADELRVLARSAPTAGLRRSLRRAQDALDDGLPAETVAAELYRIRSELEPGQESRPESPSR
ncbi:MAG TPA: hypothetical protein VM674_00635 [Candidatus Acidoferrum sp.]|nr:hypothetical protein [Candidatus Acidoferrum sp.]